MRQIYFIVAILISVWLSEKQLHQASCAKHSRGFRYFTRARTWAGKLEEKLVSRNILLRQKCQTGNKTDIFRIFSSNDKILVFDRHFKNLLGRFRNGGLRYCEI